MFSISLIVRKSNSFDITDLCFYLVVIFTTPFFPLSPYNFVAFAPFSTSMEAILFGSRLLMTLLLVTTPSITYNGSGPVIFNCIELSPVLPWFVLIRTGFLVLLMKY